MTEPATGLTPQVIPGGGWMAKRRADDGSGYTWSEPVVAWLVESDGTGTAVLATMDGYLKPTEWFDGFHGFWHPASPHMRPDGTEETEGEPEGEPEGLCGNATPHYPHPPCPGVDPDLAGVFARLASGTDDARRVFDAVAAAHGYGDETIAEWHRMAESVRGDG